MKVLKSKIVSSTNNGFLAHTYIYVDKEEFNSVFIERYFISDKQIGRVGCHKLLRIFNKKFIYFVSMPIRIDTFDLIHSLIHSDETSKANKIPTRTNKRHFQAD